MLTLNIQIFAGDEIWKYRIENERFADDIIVATRTVNGTNEDFVVLEPQDGGWNYKDLFEKPNTILSRFLIGKFTLQSKNNSKKIIENHSMHLAFDWVNAAKGHLKIDDLRSLPYQNEYEKFVLMHATLKTFAINN